VTSDPWFFCWSGCLVACAVFTLLHDKGGIFHCARTTDRVGGPNPERRSYASFASFRDADGNRWMLQEITQRLPGR
jgi:hypothetical protein